LGDIFILNWKPIFISYGSPASNMSNPGPLADSVYVKFMRNVSLTCRAQKTRRSRKCVAAALCCSRPIAIMRIL